MQFDTGFHERNCYVFLSIMRILKVVKCRMSLKGYEGTLKNSFYALVSFSFRINSTVGEVLSGSVFQAGA